MNTIREDDKKPRESILGTLPVFNLLATPLIRSADTVEGQPAETEENPTSHSTTVGDARGVMALVRSDLGRQVEERAYKIYELEGRCDGHADSHWLKAEQELLKEHSNA